MSKKQKQEDAQAYSKVLMLDLQDPKWATYEGRMNGRPLILKPGVHSLPVVTAEYLTKTFPFLFTSDPEKVEAAMKPEAPENASGETSDPEAPATSTDLSGPTDSGSEE